MAAAFYWLKYDPCGSGGAAIRLAREETPVKQRNRQIR
ncbi:hypothetical protein PS850_06101 [Pseudomonas fluorescens]|nr:hypothetical protein PS850_06101 [Pseudomonas fluorescens]